MYGEVREVLFHTRHALERILRLPSVMQMITTLHTEGGSLGREGICA